MKVLTTLGDLACWGFILWLVLRVIRDKPREKGEYEDWA